jgi:dienelactone hydrolase
MGLFWSADRGRPPSPTEAAPEDGDEEEQSPDQWTLTAEVGSAVVARVNIRRRLVSADVRVTRMHADGLVGMFYEPPGDDPHPAMLVVGGSEGGMPGPSGAPGGLASHGYAVLSLAYFRADGLPPVLSRIPLEYFARALRWLAAQPSVDAGRIGILGTSRGGELALLLGSAFNGLHAVVAYVPSDVVRGGCCGGLLPFAWTIEGKPLATMPSRGGNMVDAQRAAIPVEKIHGAVFLVSGRDDDVWDSSGMTKKIVARLQKNHFAHPFESYSYDHAGHAIRRPYTSTMILNSRNPLTGLPTHMGGTPAGTAKAREDSWRHMIAFVDHNLRDLKSGS